MKIKLSLLAATAVALLAMPALANGPVVAKTTVTKTTTTHHVWSFDALDANHDGAISKEEWLVAAGGKPDAGKRFDALDKNHDGKLSKAEFALRHPHRATHEQYHWTKTTRVSPGGSTSMPPANNEVRPNDYHPGGADGAGGWTAQ